MKLLKKVLTSLIALPVSSFIIFIIYVFLYLFLGKAVYINAIYTLQDFSVLLKQFTVLAIALYIAIFTFQITLEKINKKESKISTKIFAMLALILLSSFLPILLVYYLLSDLVLFRLTFFILWVAIVAILALVYAVKDFIDVWIINSKLHQMKKKA